MPAGLPTETAKSDKHHAIWNTRRSEAQKLIQRLLKAALKPAAIRQRVVGAKHGWGMTMQDQLDFRALEAWSAERITQHDAMVVLSEMIMKSATHIEEFESLFRASEIRRRQAPKHAQKWRFVIPFAFRCAQETIAPVKLRVLGRTFTIQSWRSAIRTLGKARVGKALYSLNSHEQRTKPVWCVTATAEGRDLDSAWIRLDSSFDALRGMIEFVLGYLQQTLKWPEGPFRTIPHPPWMLGWNRESKTLEHREFLTDEPSIEVPREALLNKRLISALRHNLSLFAGEPASNADTRSILADGLRLYVQALDSNRHYRIYLGLWQCAEAITLVADHHGSGEKARTRLAKFARDWNCDTSAMIDVLRALYKKRNKIVHRGIYDELDLEDVNIVKNCCESGLAWLMVNAKRLTTRAQLEAYYECSELNHSDFDAVEKAVKFAKAIRASSRRERKRT